MPVEQANGAAAAVSCSGVGPAATLCVLPHQQQAQEPLQVYSVHSAARMQAAHGGPFMCGAAAGAARAPPWGMHARRIVW